MPSEPGLVVIPAYQPDHRLPDLVAALVARGFRVVVVDDGSDGACRAVFARVAAMGPVEVCRHRTNRGKGAALRTGFRHALRRHPDTPGLVTADADGQHTPEAVRAVAAGLASHPDRLILGTRVLSRSAPIRSRAGNAAAARLFHLVHGERLRDTQTGLRGVPRRLAEAMLGSAASGYEFELEMLIVARQLAIRHEAVEIEARYLDGNASSHFAPVRDSARVGWVLVRFAAVWLLAGLLDGAIFFGALALTGGTGPAQAAARLVAGVIGLHLNRRLVLLRRSGDPGVIHRYWGVVGTGGLLAYGALTVIHRLLDLPVPWAKVVVESLLFPGSFILLRDFVFRGSRVGDADPGGVPSREPLHRRRPLTGARPSGRVAAALPRAAPEQRRRLPGSHSWPPGGTPSPVPAAEGRLWN